MRRRAAILVVLVACGMRAQPPAFDVASVKPAAPGGRGMTVRPGKGSLSFENATLRQMMMFAWDMREAQVIGGPGWLSSEVWDVVAKTEGGLPQGPEGEAKTRAMLRATLTERFQLVTHQETKEMPAYSLITARGGVKCPKSADQTAGATASWRGGTLKLSNGTMAQLAQMLTPAAGRNVYDETGLEGKFDVTLNYIPVPPTAANADGTALTVPQDDNPSLFTALQEQLGLRLESKKRPVNILVIDKAEKATEN